MPKKPLFRIKAKERTRLPRVSNMTECRRVKTIHQEEEFSHSRKKRLDVWRESLGRKGGSPLMRDLSLKMVELTRLGVIDGGSVRNVKYEGHIRIPTVYNDYHSSKTNGGYSRNKYGCPYPK